MINDTGNETKIPTIDSTEKQVALQIKTNKQDLNRVINHYLDTELSSTYDYQSAFNRPSGVIWGYTYF